MKQTKKQMKAQLINEVRRQYDTKISSLEARLHDANERLSEAYQKQRELVAKMQDHDELVEENRKLHDWVNRMQDFCNMPPDQFKKELEKMQNEYEASNMLKNLTRYTSYLFGNTY